MNALQIILPGIIGLSAVVMAFFRRLPACLVAYIAFVAAALLKVFAVPADRYLIWGFIAVIDTVNIYASRIEPPKSMHIYTVVGCFVGCLLGVAFYNTATVMIGGFLGAILGFIAYTRTPVGRLWNAPMSHKLSILAASGCSAWFTFILAATVALSY